MLSTLEEGQMEVREKKTSKGKEKISKISDNIWNHYFSGLRRFSTLFLSVNKWEEGLIETSINVGMLLSKRTGMYRWSWWNGKKQGSKEGSRWVRQGLISATGCGSCALGNVKLHTGQSSMFLVVIRRFPESIPKLTQTWISGTKVGNPVGLGVQLRVYELWL